LPKPPAAFDCCRIVTLCSRFAEGTLGAIHLDDHKYRLSISLENGWVAVKRDWPILTNLRLDPFECFSALLAPIG
jgi:hypothetical protein